MILIITAFLLNIFDNQILYTYTYTYVMRVTSGFIFYFCVFMIVLTVLLSFLYFKKIRHLIFKIIDKLQIGDGTVFRLTFWIVFAIVTIILVDSIMTYLAMKESLSGKQNITQEYKASKLTILKALNLIKRRTILQFTKN